MPFGEIHHVDVIPHAGAVMGRPVAAKYLSSRRPIATWDTKGKRLLGMPRGSSPILPLGWAPTGLK